MYGHTENSVNARDVAKQCFTYFSGGFRLSGSSLKFLIYIEIYLLTLHGWFCSDTDQEELLLLVLRGFEVRNLD